MLLNSGRDLITAQPFANWPYARFLAIGSDGAPPAPEQTRLGLEVARADRLQFTLTPSFDIGTNTLRITVTQLHEIVLAQDAEIREFGFTEGPTSSTFFSRELVRRNQNDPNSPPMAVFPRAGDRIRISSTFTASIRWAIEPVSFLLTGPGTVTGHGGFFIDTSNPGAIPSLILNTLEAWWPFHSPNWLASENPRRLGFGILRSGVPSLGRDTGVELTTTTTATAQPEAYVPGSFFRNFAVTHTFPTALALQGWSLGRYSTVGLLGGGYKFILVSPPGITPSPNSTINLNFRVSWQ